MGRGRRRNGKPVVVDVLGVEGTLYEWKGDMLWGEGDLFVKTPGEWERFKWLREDGMEKDLPGLLTMAIRTAPSDFHRTRTNSVMQCEVDLRFEVEEDVGLVVADVVGIVDEE